MHVCITVQNGFITVGLKWQPTPALLPGKFYGQRSLVGCRLWGRTESDTTDVTVAAAVAG